MKGLEVAAHRSAAGQSVPLVLVTGGKGGVGKTTVAANLGLSLGRLGAEPLLVDLDFGLANLNVILGLPPGRTVENFLRGTSSLAECLQSAPHGVRVLPAGSGSFEMGRPDARRRQRLLQGLATLAPRGPIIGDSPAGIGDDVLDFAVRSDRVLVVTTPEPAAVTDAYGVIKAVDAYAAVSGIEVPTPELFVNLAANAVEARSIADKLRSVCERFLSRSPRLVGWMPRSRCVLRGVIEQRPFVLGDPRSMPARGMERLARRYAALAGPKCVPKGSGRDGR